MAEKKKTPQNGEQTAAPQTEQDDKEHVLHIDTENDMLYFIDDDGERIDITKAELLTDKDRERLHKATEKLFAGITLPKLDTSVIVPKIDLPKVDLSHVSEMAKNATAGATLIKEAIKEAGLVFFTQEFKDLLQELRDNLQPVQDLLDEIRELEPYLKAELNKDKYDGKTLDFVMNNYTPGEMLELRRDPTSFFAIAMEAARATKESAETTTAKRAEKIEYPLDKINSRAWNLLTENTSGQLQIAFDLLPKRQNLQAAAYYSINFDSLGDNVKITKRLQPFDKRVYVAVSALYNAGNDVITATQIYYAMGNTGKPGAKHIKRIDDALSKMTGATITLDTQHEYDALKGKYPLFVYDGSLLPMERITAIVNGQITESAIHIFREPPLMTFAKERKQVTTIDVALLQSPINKTDANLSIDDYLIDRISKAKNKKGKSCRILFKTLYEHADIKSKMQRQRAPEKIEKYLTYYQQQNFIKRYTMQKDGVTIYF